MSLGALATILLLAFPTFVQQAVQIGKTQLAHPGNEFASVPRATGYQAQYDINEYYDMAKSNTWFNNG